MKFRYNNQLKAHKVKEPEHRGGMLRPMDFNELAAKTMRLEERIRELSDKLSKLEKQNYLLREQLNDNSYRQP
jgi:predicted transcriptional regulator